MPLDRTCVGWTTPWLPARRVTAESVDAYAAALGVPSDPVPPTFLATFAVDAWRALLEAPEIGLLLDGVVHVEERQRLHRPLTIGDEITSRARITRVRPRDNNTWLGTDVTLAAGKNVIASISSTFVVPHANVPAAVSAREAS